MTYRPFHCHDCGDALAEREVANEDRDYVAGTALSRVRAVRRYCCECHAVHEYQRHLAMEARVREVLADLTDEQRAAYFGRKAAR